MTRPTLIALSGLAIAVIAIVLALTLDTGDSVAPPAPPVTPAPVQPPPPAAMAPRLPGFDVVRIGEDGNAVMAGHAPPKSDVHILDDGREVGRVTADARGEWVFVPTGPLPPGARTLTVESHAPDGTIARSNDPVILVVPERGNGPALALKSAGQDGVTLLSGPKGADGPIGIALVDRDAKGQLIVGGNARPGGTVQLYLDGKFVGRTQADAEGSWRLHLKDDGGNVLRADLVDGSSKVIARVEVTLARAGAQAEEGHVVVEKGNSLWRIAHRLYGDGPAFTIIYQANKDLIRDPDLIYPGQVLQLPKNKN